MEVTAETPQGREAPATKSPNRSRAVGSRAPRRHLRAPRPASMFGARRQSVLAVTSPRCPQGTAAMQGTPKLDRLRHRPRDSGQQGPPGLATGGLPHRVHRDDSEPTGKCRRRREAAAPAPACSPRGRPDTKGQAWASDPRQGVLGLRPHTRPGREERAGASLSGWRPLPADPATQLTVGGQGQRLRGSPAVHHVPQTHRPVPRGTGQDRLRRAEAQTTDGPLVTGQDLRPFTGGGKR